MKSSSFISALVAITFATSSLSYAQGRGNQPGHEDRDEMRRSDQRESWGRDNSERDQRWAQRGAGPNHDFRRGDRLPMEYRHRNYVVDDWRGHHLSAPPRGYHWVQSGGDYILVAIASGLILQILLNQ
jgi:Ni/Co efflux regulator RcnB